MYLVELLMNCQVLNFWTERFSIKRQLRTPVSNDLALFQHVYESLLLKTDLNKELLVVFESYTEY